MNDQLKLNNELLAVCTADKIDYDRAEELLRQGAQPMGEALEGYDKTNLYYGVLDELFQNDETSVDFYLITKLFLKYGLDVSKPAIPYAYSNEEHDDIIHPLFWFSFRANDIVKETLKLLLDNGLKAEDAVECWGYSLADLVNLGCNLTDDWERGEFIDFIKKVLLIASYPHVLEADEELQDVIWYRYNNYDPINFRDWNGFEYEIDPSRCERYPNVRRSVVTVIEKASGQAVWKFGVELTPEDL